MVKMSQWPKFGVLPPILAPKMQKNGGFLRVCGCFCGWWGVFYGLFGIRAGVFLSETRTGCHVAGFFVA